MTTRAVSRYTFSMDKILVTRRLAPNVIDKLRANFEVDMWDQDTSMPREELLKRVQGVSGILCLITELIDEEVLEVAGDNLKVVSTMSVGFDHIDTKACLKKGIRVGFTPDVLTDSVADLTIAMMIVAGRRLREAADAASKGQWDYWRPYWMTGYDITRATIGIVGLGRIGATVAKRLKGFDANIIYYDPFRKPELEAELGVKHVELDELLAQSDFITLHIAYGPETHEMFNANTFAKMKPSAVFVNNSRGALVNHTDLYNALKDKKIFAASLDTTFPEPLPTSHPLFALPNCTIFPHVGSASIETRNQMGLLAADNLINCLTGQPMPKELVIK